MFDRDLLPVVRPRPSDTDGLVYAGGVEEDGLITAGATRSASGEIYRIKNGYLDLLGRKTGADNVANLTNFLPGAGRGYEPLWRVRSLTLLTGEPFSNNREIEVMSDLVGLESGGLFLDLGCSAGLYTRTMAHTLDDTGEIIGIDIAPSMLGEAARQARKLDAKPSFARADAENLPFADETFAGAVCGGSLNEFGDPARVLRETSRVLEPGGRLAVMGILRSERPGGRRLQRFLSIGGVQFFAPEQLQSVLVHSGFDPDPLQIYGAVFFAGATRRTPA